MSTTVQAAWDPVALRHARWGFAFLAVATVLGTGGLLYGGFGASSAVPTPFRPVLAGLSVLLPLGSLALGLAQLWRAAAGSVRAAKAATALLSGAVLTTVLGVIGLFVPASGLLLVGLFALPLLIASGAFALIGYASYAPSPRWRPPGTPVRRDLLIAALGTALLALVAVGLIELLVWMPQTLAPGFELDALYAELSEADRRFGIAAIVIWGVIWALAGIGWVVVVATLSRRFLLSVRGVLASWLLLAGCALFFQNWAGFGLGMNISDTVPPGIGGLSAGGYALALVSQVSLVGGLLGIVAPRRKSPGSDSAPA